MTDLTEHDRKIIEAAELVADTRQRDGQLGDPLSFLVAAIAAKREAARPKLLTAEEAVNVSKFYPSTDTFTGLDAVLDAAHARAFKVIEACPRYYAAATLAPGLKGEFGPATIKDAALLSDIRTALGVKP